MNGVVLIFSSCILLGTFWKFFVYLNFLPALPLSLCLHCEGGGAINFFSYLLQSPGNVYCH